MKKLIIIASALIVIITACAKKSVEEIAPTPAKPPVVVTPVNPANPVAKVNYNTDIKVILDTKCATTNCHSVAGQISPDCSNYNSVKSNITVILQRVNLTTNDGGFMPQGGSKSQADVDKITQWQTDGLLEQ